MMNDVNLTDGSLNLFTALAKDAPNWSGTPGLDLNVGTTVSDKGNLTDLKKKGLLTTSKSDGQTWVYFTEAGGELAAEMGIFLGECDPKSAAQKVMAARYRQEWEEREAARKAAVATPSLVEPVVEASPRFVVKDTLAGQALDLIPSSDRRRRERYSVVDTESSEVYDEFGTKSVANATARDLNSGAYGPLAAIRAEVRPVSPLESALLHCGVDRKAGALTVNGEVWKLRANGVTHNVRCVSLVDGILMAAPIRVKTGEPCGAVRQYNLTGWERVS